MIALAETFQHRLNVGLAFFYPETCQVCRKEHATAGDGFVCARCWSRVRFIEPPFCERCGLPCPGDLTTPFECANCCEMELHFSSARSAVAAREVVREVLHRYKYQRALWFEPFLADLFLRQALPALRRRDWDFVVPVPLHAVKHREREFNQAERLAARLSAASGIPLNSKCLRRIRPTATQTLLTRQQRAANMRGAFALRPGIRLNGERMILVDDVFTTGATTSACAEVLQAAGAGDVCVWTIARGL
ncbi:MAG TPA: ComF family protein [Candidatus Sulfopaludibacter sp.]|nr:ComF family protein [Candidatus Sulfopaludibacter sp.]